MYLPRRLFSKTCHTGSKIPSQEVLSQPNINNCLKLLKSMKPITVKRDQNTKNAAVLVPVCFIDNQLSLLYTVRAPHLKVNRGQVAFPGGMEEQSDKSLEQTALRETHEEIGVPQESIQVWGLGPEIGREQVVVTPVLGFLGDLELKQLKLNPDEVGSIFSLSLDHLTNPKHFRSTQFRVGKTTGYKVPVFLGGAERVWGLTALITHIILTALIPNYYHHKIRIQPSMSATLTNINQTQKSISQYDGKTYTTE